MSRRRTVAAVGLVAALAGAVLLCVGGAAVVAMGGAPPVVAAAVLGLAFLAAAGLLVAFGLALIAVDGRRGVTPVPDPDLARGSIAASVTTIREATQEITGGHHAVHTIDN